MWEYKVINTAASGCPLGTGDTHAERLENGLNDLGKQGWELCSIVGQLIVFKRQAGWRRM